MRASIIRTGSPKLKRFLNLPGDIIIYKGEEDVKYSDVEKATIVLTSYSRMYIEQLGMKKLLPSWMHSKLTHEHLNYKIHAATKDPHSNEKIHSAKRKVTFVLAFLQTQH